MSKRFPSTFALAIVLTLGSGSIRPEPAVAQARGVELFRLMASGQLTRTTGTTRVRWLPDGRGYLEAARDSVSGGQQFYRVDPRSGRRSPLFDRGARDRLAARFARLVRRPVRALPFTDFRWAHDGRAIRFAADSAEWVYDLRRSELRELPMPDSTGPLDFATAASGEFSPDFAYYAFIRDYDNLWLFDTRSGREEQLTTGISEDNAVGFLGATPWYVWSPDSRWIAYLKADSRGFPQYPILRPLDRIARVELMRYPFTFTPPAPLELWVVEVATKTHRRIAVNSEEQPFIRDLEWLPDGSALTYQLVSRFENRLELRSVSPATGEERTLLVDEDSAYLDPPHNFRVLPDGRFLWSSERSGVRQLYVHDLKGGEPLRLITTDWAMGEVLCIDPRRDLVYFVGYPDRGLQQHFYRVKLDGTGLTRLTPEPGVHQVSMDPTCAWFTDSFSSLDVPRTVNLRAADGRLVRQLASTDVSKVAELGLPAPEVVTLRAADGATEMHGIVFRPADFDSTKRYPLVVSVYGGPHTKAVRNAWQTTGFSAQVAQLGFVVAEFDGRGTRLREKSFQTGNYMKLGQADVDDQAAAVRQLARRPWIDGGRVGVTGLSHGGYMTLMMKLRYPDVFHVAVAGAPLADPAMGPRQYTGRFMRTPDTNPDGYAKADVLAYADRLEGRLLIYHGTNDRNAVLGTTMQLVKKLVDLGKPIDLMIYPDGVHVLTGRDAVHQVKTTLSYFLEHLQPEGWERTRAAIWGAAGS